jgi:methionyl-tRNA formyltransferase
VLHFGFLNNEEHPVGRLMLERLCRKGLVPQVVVEERSGFADKKRNAYLRCLRLEDIPSSTENIVTWFNVPSVIVDNVNRIDCEQILRHHRLSLLILGNTRILKANIISLPTNGCINVHPGLLPKVRGAFPQCWSVVNDLPTGCTCHYVDVGVDTGPIIGRREFPVFYGDTLEEIVARSMFTSADLLLDTVIQLLAGTGSTEPQQENEGQTFHWPPPDVIESAQTKLAAGKYKYARLHPSQEFRSL